MITQDKKKKNELEEVFVFLTQAKRGVRFLHLKDIFIVIFFRNILNFPGKS